MTGEHEFRLTDDALRTMLARRAAGPMPSTLVPEIAEALRTTPQARGSLLGSSRRVAWRPVLVAAAFVAIAVAVAVVGSGNLVPPTPVPPTDSPSSVPSVHPTGAPTVEVTAAPVLSDVPASDDTVAFMKFFSEGNPGFGGSVQQHSEIWVVREDGTDAHAIAPGVGGCQETASWSQDGTRLVFAMYPPRASGSGPTSHLCGAGTPGTRFYLTDAIGSMTIQLDTHCVAPCTNDGTPMISPDNRSILFVRQIGGASELAILDIASGVVTELPTTRPAPEFPSWSPDGSRIAFCIESLAPDPRYTDGSRRIQAIAVVNRDGSDLAVFDDTGCLPRWSGDGSRIVYQSQDHALVPGAPGVHERDYHDIWTMSPDGSAKVRLTRDQYSGIPMWTPDGRIRFLRTIRDDGKAGQPTRTSWWIMEADGSNQRSLDLPADIVPLRGDYDPGIPWWPGP